jgi:predicted nucleic acid-binding protein
VSVECFLDTNVLVYAAYPTSDEQWKQAIAMDLIAERKFATSPQVMFEFLNVTTRKRKPGLPLESARIWLEELARREVVKTGSDLVLEAIDLADRYKIVFWNGAILAAADRAGARTLYTEDLNDGQFYGSVQAINPFKQLPN